MPSRIAALVEVGATLAAVTDRQGALACWVEAERLIVNSSCWEGDAELPSLAALLARYGEYAWLLRLVQWCWLQANGTSQALGEFSLALGLLSCNPRLGLALRKASRRVYQNLLVCLLQVWSGLE